MSGPFRDYLVGLTLVVVAAGGYQVTAAKWLKPPAIEAAPIAVRSLNDSDESLADLYPADAWQRGRAIRLKTQDGMLLFQNWEQSKGERDGGKKWRLWPLTMVIGRGLAADDAREPILIEAVEGAVIEFSSALDVMSGVAPTIQRGQLLGEVHIQRLAPGAVHKSETDDGETTSAYQVQTPGRSASGDQTLDIRTANVGIDRRKIWTTEAIEMRVGRAVMVGRDLTLHLAAATSGPNSSSNIARSLDRMELIYLRELTLPLGKPNAAKSSGIADEQGEVQIHCDGRIEYDFALDQLLLDRNVRLVHHPAAVSSANSARAVEGMGAGVATPLPDTPNVVDQFQCNTLRLTLRDPLNSDRQRSTALDWIDRIEATGSPVRMSMPSQAFDLIAGEVKFDPLEGWLIARPSASNTDEGYVQIQRGELRATLTRIVYRFNPKHPEQLGTVEVDGHGRVDYDSLASAFKSFSWRDSLRVAPLDIATPDAMDVPFGVWCDGAIRGLLADGGTFQTDRIEGVIRPVVDAASVNRPQRLGQTVAKTDPVKNNTVDRSWFPDRFSAIGNVQVRSKSLHASTPQMNLFFEQQTAQRAAAPTNDSSLRSWVSQPKSAAAGTLTGDSERGQPDKPPATIRGDQVTAKLTFGDRELTATDLSVVGNVEVTHTMLLQQKTPANAAVNAPAEPMVAVLTGDHLRIRDDSGSGDVLQLGSQSQLPARLELGDGYFIGPEIQVRLDDNYVWIPAAGEFVIPTAFLPALSSDSSSDGSLANRTEALRWTSQPRGRFGGSMTFDGRVATLGGGVILQAAIAQGNQPSELEMRGDELSFTLENAVDLRSPASFRATQLAQISLRQTSDQPVVVYVDRYAADGLRESRHEMVLSELTWLPGESPTTRPAVGSPDVAPTANLMAAASSPMQGQVIAPGPGSYRGWFRSVVTPETESTPTTTPGNQAAAFNVGMIEDSNVAVSAPKETQITGVHLIYQGEMRGDLLGRSLTFDRGVRIGRKIVEDFDTRFDAAGMDLLSEDELTLDCDQIRLAIDPSVAVQRSRFAETRDRSHSPLAVEVQASGGVVFRSRTERGLSEATAERCGYAVVKDLVSIEGVPGRPARFHQADMEGRTIADSAIRSMTLRLKPFGVVSAQVEAFSTGLNPANLPKNR
jgi:hypothetical protein